MDRPGLREPDRGTKEQVQPALRHQPADESNGESGAHRRLGDQRRRDPGLRHHDRRHGPALTQETQGQAVAPDEARGAVQDPVPPDPREKREGARQAIRGEEGDPEAEP